jgi:energy-coupling factor transporter ATP-binding protein EcfA2
VQVLNDAWPWTGTLRGRPLSVADLVARETLSPEAAASLWWTLQHGASIFVAAGPPGAGKSTLANALLEFLPEDARVYVTDGAWDRLDLPELTPPTYLLINELSAHMPLYLSGPAATRAFRLLDRGARLFGTLHARNSAEAIRVMCYESALPQAEIHAPFVFAVVHASWRGAQIERRVVEVGFLPPDGDLVHLLAAADQELNPAGLEALAAWSNQSVADVRDQITLRLPPTLRAR